MKRSSYAVSTHYTRYTRAVNMGVHHGCHFGQKCPRTIDSTARKHG